MVLINIDTLSDSELRYIAEQEELEGWEDLSREELIEELEYLYEKDDNQVNHSGSSARKFVQTLTDVDSDNVLKLPGVEDLPEHYNETSIHLIIKDFNWGYVFWSLSSQTRKELEESKAHLVLRTRRYNAAGEERAVYDIDVDENDSNWTVELPHLGHTYQSSLVAVSGSGETVVCQSQKVTTQKSWFNRNPEELKDDATFRKIFSSMVTNGGEVFGNRQVSELIDLMTVEGVVE